MLFHFIEKIVLLSNEPRNQTSYDGIKLNYFITFPTVCV